MPSPRLTTLHVFVDETHLDKMTGPLGISTIKERGLYRTLSGDVMPRLSDTKVIS